MFVNRLTVTLHIPSSLVLDTGRVAGAEIVLETPPRVAPLPPRGTAVPPLPLPMLGKTVAVGVCRPLQATSFTRSSTEGLLCLLFRLGVGLQNIYRKHMNINKAHKLEDWH